MGNSLSGVKTPIQVFVGISMSSHTCTHIHYRTNDQPLISGPSSHKNHNSIPFADMYNEFKYKFSYKDNLLYFIIIFEAFCIHLHFRDINNILKPIIKRLIELIIDYNFN